MNSARLPRRRALCLGRTALGLLLTALAVAVTGPGPAARAYPMAPDFYTLSPENVSPHVPWAKPLAGAPLRVLVIAPRGAQRETLELAERLEMQYRYVLALTPDELGWTGKSGPYASADGVADAQVVAELAEKLKADYDVIVVGHLRWDAMPLELIYTILKKVHDGTGLVYTHAAFGQTKWLTEVLKRTPPLPAAAAQVAAGVPAAALPVLGDLGLDKVLACRQFKRGRIVTLDYGKDRPRFQFLTPCVPDKDETYADGHYEYYLSLVIRSVLWAAGREPELRIAAWGEPGARLRREDLPRQHLTARLEAGPDRAEYQATMTVRRPDGTALVERRATFQGKAGAPDLSFGLDLLPRGRYFADLVVRRDGRSVDWASSYFDVETAVDIDSVTTDRATLQPGDRFTATATLTAPLPRGLRLRVQLADSMGRRLATVEPKLATDRRTAACELRWDNPLTITAEVRAVLDEDGRTVAESATQVSVIRRQWDDFRFCVWTPGHNFNEQVRRLMFPELTRAGVDTFTNSGRDEASVRRSARLGFAPIPYMTRYADDGKDTVRHPCLTDPKYLTPHLADLRQTTAVQAPYDPPGYTLGDECVLGSTRADVCFSPTCVADLRQWLPGEYASVKELNASWGTNYASFDQAEPIVLEEAVKTGQIPRWVDHRRHMEFVYARMMARAKAAIREVDPAARVGFDGPGVTDSGSGNDWWRLMDTFDLCNLYFHQPDEWEAVRSFAKPGTFLGLWYGPYETDMRRDDYNRFFPWRALMEGYNSVWWYAVYHGLAACPMDALTPSMTWYSCFAATVEELREIKGGVGKALMHAERRQDGIAIHYSQSSVHTATAYPGLGGLQEIWRQWYGLIEDLGLQYNCLAYAQIEKDGIDRAKYKVLVLPYSQAVSPREAAAVQTFVRAGGTVLADVRPAVTDQHGKAQQPGLLDELFGIRRLDGKLELKTGQQVTLTTAVGETPAGTVFTGLTVDPNVVAAGATALAAAGDVPAVLVNRCGEGRAVLLNFGLGGYRSHRTDAAARSYWTLMHGVFAMAGIQPRVRVVGTDGPLPRVEAVFFQDGAIEYLGLLKYRLGVSDAAVGANVFLDTPAWTYDVRTRRSLGRVDRFEATFQPERCQVFARLPYAVRRVGVTCGGRTFRPGAVVPLSLTLETADQAKAGRHWFRVEVIGPDGVAHEPYAQNVAVVGGRGEAVVPLALNDSPGKWRVTVRDIATGTGAEAGFSVR